MSISPLQDCGLDDPARYALAGTQRGLGVHALHSGIFRADVGPFAYLDDPEDPEHWVELRALAPDREVVVLDVPDELVPADWTLLRRIVGRQMVDTVIRHRDNDDLVELGELGELGEADIPDMLDLVNRTQPGPFAERTIDLGGYLGVRGPVGQLLAMAGRRMWAGDAIEVSAVCSDPAARGQGLARRVVHAVAAGIQAEDATPYLHVADANTPAIALYESMGFVPRREVHFVVLTPSVPSEPDYRRGRLDLRSA
jgi:ribosomal protein S18 acetylase RimI-like enzyme